VCAPTADGTAREVADFGATTPELMRLGQWLKQRKVESVAMESTGVYWIAPHEVLEAAGLEILLVASLDSHGSSRANAWEAARRRPPENRTSDSAVC